MASSHGRIMVTPHEINGRTYGGTPTYGQWTHDCSRFIYCRRGHTTRKVSRLICEAFHGPAPNGKPVCMHLDESSRNNKPENLAWGTQKENLNAPGFLTYCHGRMGVDNPRVHGQN